MNTKMTIKKTTALGAACAALALSACGTEMDTFAQAGDALQRETIEDGILAFVNNPATDLEALDILAALDLRAAKNILAVRDGKDGKPGTADDNLFATIAELDAVPYVGPATLDALKAFAYSIGFYGDSVPGTYDGVYFGGFEAETVVEIANRATAEQWKRIGLDSRQVTNLSAARPIANAAALAAVPYIANATMTKIHAFITIWTGGEEQKGAGALFDGVAYGPKDIEIALEIANHATYEQLVTLGGLYQYGAKIVIANRPASGYGSFSLVAAQRGIGPNTVERLLAFARSGKWVRVPPPAPAPTEPAPTEPAPSEPAPTEPAPGFLLDAGALAEIVQSLQESLWEDEGFAHDLMDLVGTNETLYGQAMHALEGQIAVLGAALVGTTYPSHDDARDAVSNHVHIKSRLTEGGWLYLESIGIARPVVPIATAEKALEAARYELVKYVTNVFLKSPEYLAVYGTDAAAATAFRDSAQAFGTSASPAKTTTWSWGWSFDGLVNGVSTEVSVITDGTSEIAMQLE